MNTEIDDLIVNFITDYNILSAELNEYVGKHTKKPRGRPLIYLTHEDRKLAYREKYKYRLDKITLFIV
jgi:hypothetical protein